MEREGSSAIINQINDAFNSSHNLFPLAIIFWCANLQLDSCKGTQVEAVEAKSVSHRAAHQLQVVFREKQLVRLFCSSHSSTTGQHIYL